jgi:methionyl-tRNA formyltransferase
LPVFQPASLRTPEAAGELEALAPDLMIVAAYGLLLPQQVLDTPRLGCVNVHASLLPRWRGAAPIQRAILAGDRESGITIMGMEAGLDTGPMYLARGIPIGARETGGSLHDRLAVLGAEAMLEALPGILDGSLIPRRQQDAAATYAKKLSKEEAVIDWRRPAAEIDRMIRAFTPWPVAQTMIDGNTLRLWGSELPGLSAGTAAPGSVVATCRSGIDVATGDGMLRITHLQPPGKRPMTAAEYLNARVLEGAVFS